MTTLEQEKQLTKGAELAMARQYEEALEILEDLADQGVDVVLLWRKLSYVQSQLCNYAAARDAIERALLLEPDDPGNWLSLSRHCLELELKADALDAGRQMVAVCERQNNTYYMDVAYFILAETALRGGCYSEAISACQKLAPDFYYWIGEDVRKIADIKKEAEAAIEVG
jgi:tetratricopeptide (TPR) repeat protein